MRLDELLDELQAHVEVVRSTRDRVNGLLEAVLSVGSDLDLETVLRRIVESAVSLVDAEYGALGVIGDEERLARFLPVGMDADTILRIGPFPTGRGILGLIIRDPHPLRLHDLSEHPDSFGFPPGHPPMNTFVGVPIRIRDTVFGNLYLTEKRGGTD
ncbi:GAF domain-containing protein, partial [Embleya sp. NPDC059259]